MKAAAQGYEAPDEGIGAGYNENRELLLRDIGLNALVDSVVQSRPKKIM